MAKDVFLLRSAGPPGDIKQEPEDDSDADEEAEEAEASVRKAGEAQIIHSGHFMVSSPHSEHPPKKGYDFDTVNRQTCQTYCFGPLSTSHLSIDASLTKLFECMTLAYSGKLVSPKWKNFKGLKLLWRDKIRLNNAIWRAWYMQYVEKRDNPVCHFVTPLDGTIEFEEPRRPEATATEGKFWKRRIEIVIREYHKWRTYFKKRLQKHKDEDLSSLIKLPGFDDGCPEACCPSFQDEDLVAWRAKRKGNETPVPMEQDQLLDMDMLMSEFSDTLFSTLSSHHPVAWPNPREIAHAGNADMIQPGLIPLQPNLDFMDTFEPFQDFFPMARFPSLVGSIFSSPTSSVPPITLGTSSSPPQGFRPQASLTSQQTFLPLFSPAVPSPQTPSTQPPAQATQPTIPHSPPLITQSSFASPASRKFGFTPSPSPQAPAASQAAATTFTQKPKVLATGKQQGAPCSLAMQPPKKLMPFAVPKAAPHVGSSSRTPKQLQKIVPALKSELVPIASVASPATVQSPNAFLAQFLAAGSGAVLVTSSPLKPELASAVTQPSVVITPAGIATATGVTDFHGSILVGPAQQSGVITASSQTSQSAKSTISQLFASNPIPSAVQIQSKAEQVAPQTSNEHVSSATARPRERQASGQGSPAVSERIPSPQSPTNNSTNPKTEVVVYKSLRMTHISAEQKRRFNIKMAFDTLHSLVATLKSQSNAKPISNAVTLQKTVEYIAKLQQERTQMQEEAKRLREEIEELNASINTCQQQLPATGVPITRQRFHHTQEMFDEYVKSRTLQNWKFWIFSIIIKPLFESFNNMVSTSSLEDLGTTTMSWLDQHCSLLVLRPMVLNTLRQLSTTTSILSDPSLMPEQATQAVSQISKNSGNS
ncbi:MLX-interacting protein isoform X1 [Callorhinchus milii]|uniref:MLX-interacting protein isoform X1 n=1 Tax=Callorhinchus milii TaxID=7868 RepID=UPI001C3F6976|nr:MLX-interacting protein isoform X1 [Callorhinchus milii]